MNVADLDFNSKKRPNNGLEALISLDALHFDRLPMLVVILDRFTRVFVEGLHSSTAESVSADVHAISSLRFDDYIREIPANTLTCIFKVKELENSGLIVLDRNFIYSMANILLGGKHFNKAKKIDEKSYTLIEHRIVEYLIELIFKNLKSAFSLVADLNFSIDRLETNPRFATIVQPADGVILMQVKVDIDNTGGMMEIVLPYITLEPISESLKKVFKVDNQVDKMKWERCLESIIEEVKVEIEVVLGECFLRIKDMKNMQVGTLLTLDNIREDSTATMNVNGKKMFNCTRGCTENRVTVQIQALVEG